MKPEWLKPSDAYGCSAVIRNVLPLVALLWVAPLLAVFGSMFATLRAIWAGKRSSHV